MTLAFPSSPHCVPTTTVAGTLVQVTRAATHRSRKAGQGISQASLLLNGHSCAVKHASMKMDYIQTAALVADNYSCASLFKIKTVLHVGSDAFDLQHFKHRHFQVKDSKTMIRCSVPDRHGVIRSGGWPSWGTSDTLPNDWPETVSGSLEKSGDGSGIFVGNGQHLPMIYTDFPCGTLP
jgi:hypothetical protein